MIIYEGRYFIKVLEIYGLALAELAVLSSRWEAGDSVSVAEFDGGVYATLKEALDQFQRLVHSRLPIQARRRLTPHPACLPQRTAS